MVAWCRSILADPLLMAAAWLLIVTLWMFIVRVTGAGWAWGILVACIVLGIVQVILAWLLRRLDAQRPD